MERILRARALALTQGEILDRLSETAIIHGLDLDAAEEVGALCRKRMATLEDAERRSATSMLQQQLIVALATDHRARSHALYGRDGRRYDFRAVPAGCC